MCVSVEHCAGSACDERETHHVIPNCCGDKIKESDISFMAENGRYLLSLFIMPSLREILSEIIAECELQFINSLMVKPRKLKHETWSRFLSPVKVLISLELVSMCSIIISRKCNAALQIWHKSIGMLWYQIWARHAGHISYIWSIYPGTFVLDGEGKQQFRGTIIRLISIIKWTVSWKLYGIYKNFHKLPLIKKPQSSNKTLMLIKYILSLWYLKS